MYSNWNEAKSICESTLTAESVQGQTKKEDEIMLQHLQHNETGKKNCKNPDKKY